MSEQADIPYTPERARIAGIASLVTVAVLIIVKAIALVLTGSTAILASLIDSLVDAVVSSLNMLAIHLSLKPADNNHRHGHGKVEGLAALLQASFITGAGVFLAMESIRRMVDPVEVKSPGIAVAIMVVAIILSVGLIAVQKWVLRHAPSLAVEAESAHYASDIVVNGGVIAALGIHALGGPWWVDPAFALCVSVWFGFLAFGIARKGIDMLLDRELPPDVRDRIVAIIRASKGVEGVHDLRTRASGMQIHITFDIEVDPALRLSDAHDICRAVENDLLRAFPHAEIMIHLDPLGDVDDSRHPVKAMIAGAGI